LTKWRAIGASCKLMPTIEERIQQLDTQLFEPIYSPTTTLDRLSLLLLQNCVRTASPYTYLEIGSYLGGSLQTHYIDPRCQQIYSIDNRALAQNDESGAKCRYPGNGLLAMLKNLSDIYPQIEERKVQGFNGDVRQVATAAIKHPPHLCLIDGEHTNQAVVADFLFCLQVAQPDALIGFHRVDVVYQGVGEAKQYLQQQGIPHLGILLKGRVYVLLLRGAVARYQRKLQLYEQDEQAYFMVAAQQLRQAQFANRYPKIAAGVQKFRQLWRRKPE
jgi:hypothetical protein